MCSSKYCMAIESLLWFLFAVYILRQRYCYLLIYNRNNLYTYKYFSNFFFHFLQVYNTQNCFIFFRCVCWSTNIDNIAKSGSGNNHRQILSTKCFEYIQTELDLNCAYNGYSSNLFFLFLYELKSVQNEFSQILQKIVILLSKHVFFSSLHGTQ